MKAALPPPWQTMLLELDHIFICSAVGAPEGDALVRHGLVEGSGNTHPGQGTANRRFFFSNGYLELLWIASPDEAQSEGTRRTRLWERWSRRGGVACPFGFALRPAGEAPATAPFPTWVYRPPYLPAGFAIEFAQDVPLSEPEWFYLPFVRRPAERHEPMNHSLTAGDIGAIAIGMPSAGAPCAVSAAAAAAAGVRFFVSNEYVMEIEFTRAGGHSLDLRPVLPLRLLRLTAAP
jgi:hypothetical protein